MKVLSPYGKDVLTELKDVYNLNSVDELLRRVRHFLSNDYGFDDVDIEMIHVAFGTAIKFKHDAKTYYLKFAGRANHHHPEELFLLLEYLRQAGLPLPEVLKTLDGVYFKNIFESSGYDVTYVMREVQCEVMAEVTPKRLEQFTQTLAKFHRLGESYEPKVYAKARSIHDFLRDAITELEPYSYTTKEIALLKQITPYIQTVFEDFKRHNALSKTHIYWDFRFCHVLFEGDTVTGILDSEQSTYAERIYDVCVAIVSHSNPARCLLLNPQQVLGSLKRYDELYPFNSYDHRGLKAMLLCALLNELGGKLLFLQTGQSESKQEDVDTTWAMLELVYNELIETFASKKDQAHNGVERNQNEHDPS
jgi:Ser/Thr protein kinase RdoA (MazF antagonist)